MPCESATTLGIQATEANCQKDSALISTSMVVAFVIYDLSTVHRRKRINGYFQFPFSPISRFPFWVGYLIFTDPSLADRHAWDEFYFSTCDFTVSLLAQEIVMNVPFILKRNWSPIAMECDLTGNMYHVDSKLRFSSLVICTNFDFIFSNESTNASVGSAQITQLMQHIW